MFLLGRLRPGFTREQAIASLSGVKPDYPPSLREGYLDDRPALSSLMELNQQFHVELYWLLLGAVGFLYAIACLNASNLMLVRMLGQRRELCIRLAMGCGRWRLIRLLALECFLLALVAALVGAIVAKWLFPLLMTATGGSIFVVKLGDWNLSWRVLGVLGLLSVVTSLCMVALPALRVLRAEIYSGQKDGGAALGERPALGRIRGGFVVIQAAFTVILLAGAGLMVRTFQHLRNVDPGFEVSNRVKVNFQFPADYPVEPEARLARLREIQEQLRRVPGVRDAGFSSDFLMSGFYFAGYEFALSDGSKIKAAMATFNIGFHEATRIKLKRGRWLNQTQGNEIMVNEAFARARWPNADLVGQLLKTVEVNRGASADGQGWLVVGVVGDTRSTIREAPGMYLFGPGGWGPAGVNSFIVRLSQEYDAALASTIQRTLYAFDPRIVVYRVVPLDQLRDQQLWAERMADSVLKVLAGIALLLRVVGIFSVLAYTVDRRMGEFGVRMAMGATPRDLMQLVMRRGVLLAFTGIVLGIGGAVALTRYMKTLLFETSANEPWVLVAVGGILLVTTVLACVLPARRATKVDVTLLLRSE